MAGSELPIVWRGRRVHAYLPDPVADVDLDLDARTAAALATAAAFVEQAAAALPSDFAPVARLLLRSEGVASSFIEGIKAPIVDIVIAEITHAAPTTAAALVASNMAVVSAAIEHASTAKPLGIQQLLDWHRGLLAGSPTPAHHVGVIRDEQGWIGGTSPMDAHLVTPPHERVAELLDDLLRLLNRSDIDAIEQAAIAHVQFESIHPFADGNGRMGRLLVSWVLTRRLGLLAPPPVSTAIAADAGGYVAGLTQFRYTDELAWVRWFADAVAQSARAQMELASQAAAMLETFHAELIATPGTGTRPVRADSLAFRVLRLLPRHVILTSRIVIDELGSSVQASLDALRTLTKAGVLAEHEVLFTTRTGRPATLFVCERLLGLAGASIIRH